MTKKLVDVDDALDEIKRLLDGVDEYTIAQLYQELTGCVSAEYDIDDDEIIVITND